MINFNGHNGLNVNLIFQHFDKVKNRQLGLVSKAAKICIESLKRLSLVYTPRDTGLLRKSAKITKLGPYQYELSYGDDEAWYAVIVHEEPRYRHQWPTRFNYLLDAVNDLSNGVSSEFGEIASFEQIFNQVFSGWTIDNYASFFESMEDAL